MLLYFRVVDVENVVVVVVYEFANATVYDVGLDCEYSFQLISSLYAFRLFKLKVINVPVMY